MSEIKTIETGRTTLLAVKVPEGVKEFCIPPLSNILFYSCLNSGDLKPIELPFKAEIIALSTEITEEQARELVPIENLYEDWDGIKCAYKNHLPFDVLKSSGLFETALESFNSLMQANQCFSVNPYGETKPFVSIFDDNENSSAKERRWKWQEAEANTGPHLILRKL